MGLKEGLALDYFNLGRIFVARQDWAQAREVLVKSVELYRGVGNDMRAREIEQGLAQMEQSSRASGGN